MEFYAVYRQHINNMYRVHPIFNCFARQPENEVRARVDSALLSLRDRRHRLCEGVPSVYAFQRDVGARLNAVLNGDEHLARQLCKIVKFLIINAIRSCADDNALNVGAVYCRRINLFQIRQWRVGIRKRLKISKVRAGSPVSVLVELNAFVQLLRNAFQRRAVRWVECGVEAVCAAAVSNRAVSVWAAEARVYRQFLYPRAESGSKKAFV